MPHTTLKVQVAHSRMVNFQVAFGGDTKFLGLIIIISFFYWSYARLTITPKLFKTFYHPKPTGICR